MGFQVASAHSMITIPMRGNELTVPEEPPPPAADYDPHEG